MRVSGTEPIKVMIVAGTKPEAIKLAPVIQKLHQRPDNFKTTIVTTGEHRQLLEEALSLFSIRPDIDLNLFDSKGDMRTVAAQVLENVSVTLGDVRPDIVLIQGDSTSVLASSLASFYQQIPVAHIEAGLRSRNKYNPFPEEINRHLTTVIADIHFAPTPFAKEVLLSEGIDAERIVVTGNTVIDALLHVSSLPFFTKGTVLEQIDLNKHRLVLVTSHRRESWGLDLQNICEAIKEITQKHEDVVVVYPVFPNPMIKITVEKVLGGIERVHLTKPLDYLTFINVMKRSCMVLTDSGGLQEEAPSLKKPLLLMRDVTERPEAFEAGLAKFVGTEKPNIIRAASELLDDKSAYHAMTNTMNPFGDGQASDRIVSVLYRWAKGKKPLLVPCVEFEPLTPEESLLCQNH